MKAVRSKNIDLIKILLKARGDLNIEIFSFIDLAISNNLTDFIYTLIKGEVKLNILNSPDERIVSTYGLSSVFQSNFDFNDSSILTASERISLKQMLNILTEGTLIYKASKNGFSADSFHSRCAGISNTITIIKTTSNSVFGGFTSTSWSSNNDWNYDANAFIFSLRREGKPNKQRLNVTQPEYAVYNYYSFGPIFGDSIHVYDDSNQNNDSFSKLGFNYQLPNNINYESEEAQNYLAGSYNWQSTEIEVYQLSPFIPYSVSFLHNGCLYSLFYYYKFYFNLFQIAVHNNNINLVNVLIRIRVDLNILDKYRTAPKI